MQTTIIIHVAGAPATAVRFVPTSGTLHAPVMAGTTLGQIQIDPTGWTGDVSLSGADATLFTVNAAMQLVTAAVMALPRDYSVTLTTQE